MVGLAASKKIALSSVSLVGAGMAKIAPLLVIIPLWVACFMGLWRLDADSIWHDEAWSIRAIDSPFGTPDDNTPFLYYLTLHGLQQLGVGHTPFALRFGSVLIQLITVAVAFRLGQRWYGPLMGLLAGLLVALSPLLWEYSQEVRAYIAVPLLALLLLGGMDAFLTARPTIPYRLWVFVLLVELAALYTHNLGVLLVVWVNVMFLVEAGMAKVAPLLWIQWAMGQAIIGVLYLPWLLGQSPSGTSLNTVPQFGGKLSQELWRGYFFPVVADPDTLPDRMITLSHILPLFAALAILLTLWRGRHLRTLLIFSQVTLLPIFSTLLLQRASIDFHPRYYILAVPATLLFLVAGVAAIPLKARWIGALVVGIGCAYSTYYSLTFIANNRQYQHDNFAAIADYYATLPPDTVILIPFDDEPAIQYYFARELGIQSQFVNISLYSSVESVTDQLNQLLAEGNPLTIELLTWYQLPADERGMLPCLLGAVGDKQGAVITYGLQSQAYVLSTPIQFSTLDLPAQVDSPLQLEELMYQSGHHGTCIQSQWVKQAETDQDYSLAAQWLNPFGWPLASSDTALLDDDQRHPTNWEINQQGQAFSLLETVAGIPQQPYSVSLRLYNESYPSGFDVVALESGQLLGKDIPLTLPFQAVHLEPTVMQPMVRRDNAVDGRLESGQRFEVEWIQPTSEAGQLRLAGTGWEVSLSIEVDREGIRWSALRVPADAEGEALLTFNEVELAHYEVIQIDRLWEAPSMPLVIESTLGEVVILAGAQVDQQATAIQVGLVWQALTETEQDYTIFVQLLDANGQLLTQADAQPAQGSRPTSGWVEGEYILDSHILNLNTVEYKGQASIIVGLYHPQSAQRLTTTSGDDAIMLPLEIELP